MIYYNIPSKIDLQSLSLEGFYMLQNRVEHIGGRGVISGKKLNKNEMRTLMSIVDYLGYLLTELVAGYNKLPSHYVQIPSWELEGVYRNYKNLNLFLKKKRLVQVDDSYLSKASSVDGNSKQKSYRLTFNPSQTKKVKCDKSAITNEFIQLRNKKYGNDRSVPVTEVHNQIVRMLKQDVIVEMDHYLTWSMDRSTFRKVVLCLNKIKNGVINVTQSKKVGRLSHVLTTIPKVGRQFVKYKDGREFTSRDISASHLYLLAVLYPDNDLQRKIDRDLYSVLARAVGMSREQFKKYVMFYLFGRFKPNKNISEAFRKILPNMNAYVEKVVNKKGFSHILMDLESQFVLNSIGEKLIKNQIPFYTVHDCVYVPQGYEMDLEKIMKQAGMENFGYSPMIK